MLMWTESRGCKEHSGTEPGDHAALELETSQPPFVPGESQSQFPSKSTVVSLVTSAVQNQAPDGCGEPAHLPPPTPAAKQEMRQVMKGFDDKLNGK